jgi:integral membrane protein
MWKTPIGRLRLIGWLEGLSFVGLVFIAMPMKYLLDEPGAVRVLGMAHGLLWVGFLAVLADTMSKEGWTLKRAAVPFVAALLPFGPFIIDRKLRDQS